MPIKRTARTIIIRTVLLLGRLYCHQPEVYGNKKSHLEQDDRKLTTIELK